MLVKIQVEGEALTKLFDEQLQSISQLIGTKKIERIAVVNGHEEEGYAVSPVNSEVNVLLLVEANSKKRQRMLITGPCGFEFAS